MKLKELRKQKGLSQEQVAKELGITLRTYQNYEYGQREPNIEMIFKLADFYGISTDYLLGRESPPENPLAFLNLNASDEEVMQKYASLPENVRKMLLDVMLQLADAARKGVDEQSQKDIIMTILKHVSRASAGSGYDLSNGDEWKKIKVVKDRNAERADFAVEVEGDSMLPEYHDGDVVYIVLDSDVPVGKVGLFRQNGKGYIKERGEKYLISTNSKFPHIYPEDGEIICIGRVIGIAELAK